MSTQTIPTKFADLNKNRNAFMQRASAPNIPHAAFKLGWLIAYRYMNRESATARPAQETLARDLNVSIRTVQRLLDILQPLGLVIVLGHGPNQASTYWLEPGKATSVSPINTTPVSPIGGPKGDIRRQNRRQPVHEKATPVSPQPYKKNQEEEPRGSKRAPHTRAHPPDFASGKGSKESSEEGSQNQDQATAIADGFARFWSAYPRKVSEDAARAAFTKVIMGGADIEAVVARAAVYAAERGEAIRTGDNPKWTPHPATWLRDGKFKDPLPSGVVIDQNGAVVAVAEEPRQRRRGEKTWAEVDAEIPDHGPF